MTKLRNPLLSLDARNSLGKALSFVRRRKQNIAESYPVPKDAKTSKQLAWRTMYQLCVDLWHTLSAVEKQAWESAARRYHMTGYAWYLSQCLRPNPGIYLPLAGGKMSGAIDMDSNEIEDLPDPSNPQDPDTLAARLAAITAHAALATVHQNAPGLIAGHAALDTGVHGVGVSTILSAANLVAHAGLATVHQDAPGLIAAHVTAAAHRWTLNKLRLGAGAGAAPTEIDIPTGDTVVRKPGDETVNNSNTLQNDDHLLLAIGANEVWYIFAFILYTTLSTPDIKFFWTTPAGGSWKSRWNFYNAGEVNDTGYQDNDIYMAAAVAGGNTGANPYVAVCFGIIINGGNAGNLQLQWAQNTINASDTKVKANSFLAARQLA